jgi:murein L,D-transpeptidase YcbB/YkuD
VMVAAIGGASAQPSDPIPQNQEAPPAAEATANPAGTPDVAAMPATPPETAAPAVVEPVQEAKPATGLDLFQVPIAGELQGTDAATAEKLRELLATRLSRAVDRRQDRAGVEAFYRDRGFAPLWIADGTASSRAKAAIAYLRGVAADGLDPADYRIPAFSDPSKLEQDEVALTNSVLAFARHARTGRLPYAKVSSAIHYELENPEAADVLANMANAGNIAEALDTYQPQHPAYKALKAKLPEARKKPGALADTVIANMERWRWLPRDLGQNHVIVNIPDYTLSVMRGGQRTFHTRIVVGKKDTPSPVFSDEIESVQVNPTWHVPPAILARNPGLVGRGDFVVSRRADGSIGASQRPGPQNALGQIKVNFPNPFLVYLHDTPDKHLFKLDKRAYSSGCMRVENPDQFAAQVLSIGAAQGNRYTPAQLTGMYNKGERVMSLATRVPIYLVYMNAYVADGQLVVKPDLYDYDARVQSALKGRYIVVQERSQRGSSVARAARPVSPPQQYRMGQWPGQTGQGRGFFGLF